MGMHTYQKVKDMLCEELERIANKGELTAGSLDTVDKLTHSIKSIDTIIAMSDYEDDYSERRMPYSRQGNNRGGNSRRGGSSYDDGMMYESNSSYARRNSSGRYSREDNRDNLISRLENMAMNTTDERMKATIHKCIDELDKD